MSLLDFLDKKASIPKKPEVVTNDGKIYDASSFITRSSLPTTSVIDDEPQPVRRQPDEELIRMLDRALEYTRYNTKCPSDTRHFMYYPCDKIDAYGVHSGPWCNSWMTMAGMFPLPARPNDRYYNTGKDITQCMVVKANRKTVMGALESLGYKSTGSKLITSGEVYYMKNPKEGIKVVAMDDGTGYTNVYFDTKQRTNRVMFDLYEELESRISGPFSVKYYLDLSSASYPKTDSYCQLPYFMITNQWERYTYHTYPAYINPHKAKLLYLYDDENSNLSYDRMWRFQFPGELKYYDPPAGARTKQEWERSEYQTTRNETLYYKNYVKQLISAYMKSIDTNCKEVYPTEEAKKESLMAKEVNQQVYNWDDDLLF